MDPKVMVMMGMGGLMCLLFIVVGIIAWVNSDDDEDDSTTGGNTSSGTSSSGTTSSETGDGTEPEPEPEPETGTEPEPEPEPETSTAPCPSGQVRFEEDGQCYPKCRGGFAWSAANASGSAWPGGGCGISDASIAWDWGGADIRKAEAENCSMRFTKADASATGYIQCIAPGEDGGVSGFCLNHKHGRPLAINECVPENHSNGRGRGEVGFESDPSKASSSKKIPKCAVPGTGGTHGAWNTGGYAVTVGDKWTNVKDEDGDYHGGSCVCPDGYPFNWHGTTALKNFMWKCGT